MDELGNDPIKFLSTVNADNLLEAVEAIRKDAVSRLEPSRKVQLAQFFSQGAIASFMVSMLRLNEPIINILDPGAGVGSLFSAVISELCSRRTKPKAISVTAYEIDERLLPDLLHVCQLCSKACSETGILFSYDIRNEDFITSAADILSSDYHSRSEPSHINCVILNPPYLRIKTHSVARAQLRKIGVETSNLYTGFMAAAAQLLTANGELVAITPRSFCNGPYFRPFRYQFLSQMSLQHLHLFDSRKHSFPDDDVVQETVIVHAIKSSVQSPFVNVSSNWGPHDDSIMTRSTSFFEVVHPNDSQRFIRITSCDSQSQITKLMKHFTHNLADLGLSVSTGRVVDFRVRDHLRQYPNPTTAPLLYPAHLARASTRWPILGGIRANAIELNSRTRRLTVPNGNYVLVKRFSSKEERRRVVAAVFRKCSIQGDVVAFENHLNYFHAHGIGLDIALAKGLSIYLNSTLVDSYLRQFSGHTQVNATDLRSLGYPSLDELRSIGRIWDETMLTQEDIDDLMETRLLMAVDHSEKRVPS